MKLLVVFNNVLRSLDEFNENTFTAERVGVLTLRVNEGNIITSSTLTNTARGETDTLLLEVLDASREVINPETNVVERRNVDLGALGRIIRFHDINFNSHRTLTTAENIFLNVFLGGLRDKLNSKKNQYFEGVDLFKTEDINPKVLESSLAGTTDGNLLETKNSVRLGSSEGTLLKHDSGVKRHVQQQ